MDRRVVVTGLGLVTALGLDEETIWRRLVAGETGIGPLTAFDTEAFGSPYKVTTAAQVDSEPVIDALRAMGRRPVDRTLDLALVAGSRALEQSALVGEPSLRTHEKRRSSSAPQSGSAQSIYEAFQRFVGQGTQGPLPEHGTEGACSNAISAGPVDALQAHRVPITS